MIVFLFTVVLQWVWRDIMTEKELLICEMADEGYTLNEMAKVLWLSSRQVHQKIQKLVSDGYFISPIYFDDGNVRYCFDKCDKKHTVNISLGDSSKFKALVISDIHIGNELENLSYLYKVYDYARDKNINVILNCGDLIDGSFTKGKQVVSDIDEQTERVINDYPYDKNILNFICFGNHDYSAYENGRDVALAISKRRPDLINVGYGFSLINIERDQFMMHHLLFKKVSMPNKLILEGHHHKALFKIMRNNFYVNVPPLSDLCFGHQGPGMIEMELFLNNGFINTGHFKQIGVKKRLEVYAENDLEFFFKKEKIDEKKLILK